MPRKRREHSAHEPAGAGARMRASDPGIPAVLPPLFRGRRAATARRGSRVEVKPEPMWDDDVEESGHGDVHHRHGQEPGSQRMKRGREDDSTVVAAATAMPTTRVLIREPWDTAFRVQYPYGRLGGSAPPITEDGTVPSAPMFAPPRSESTTLGSEDTMTASSSSDSETSSSSSSSSSLSSTPATRSPIDDAALLSVSDNEESKPQHQHPTTTSAAAAVVAADAPQAQPASTERPWTPVPPSPHPFSQSNEGADADEHTDHRHPGSPPPVHALSASTPVTVACDECVTMDIATSPRAPTPDAVVQTADAVTLTDPTDSVSVCTSPPPPPPPQSVEDTFTTVVFRTINPDGETDPGDVAFTLNTQVLHVAYPYFETIAQVRQRIETLSTTTSSSSPPCAAINDRGRALVTTAVPVSQTTADWIKFAADAVCALGRGRRYTTVHVPCGCTTDIFRYHPPHSDAVRRDDGTGATESNTAQLDQEQTRRMIQREVYAGLTLGLEEDEEPPPELPGWLAIPPPLELRRMRVSGCTLGDWACGDQAKYVRDILHAVVVAHQLAATHDVMALLITAFAWHYIRAHCAACADAIDEFMQTDPEAATAVETVAHEFAMVDVSAATSPQSGGALVTTPDVACADLLAAIVGVDVDSLDRLWTLGIPIDRHVELYPGPPGIVASAEMTAQCKTAVDTLSERIYGMFRMCSHHTDAMAHGVSSEAMLAAWRKTWTGAVVAGPVVSAAVSCTPRLDMIMQVHCPTPGAALRISMCAQGSEERFGRSTAGQSAGPASSSDTGDVADQTRRRHHHHPEPTYDILVEDSGDEDEDEREESDEDRTAQDQRMTKVRAAMNIARWYSDTARKLERCATADRPYDVFKLSVPALYCGPSGSRITNADIAFVFPSLAARHESSVAISMPGVGHAADAGTLRCAIEPPVHRVSDVVTHDTGAGISVLDCMYNMPVSDQVVFEPSTGKLYCTIRYAALVFHLGTDHSAAGAVQSSREQCRHDHRQSTAGVAAPTTAGCSDRTPLAAFIQKMASDGMRWTVESTLSTLPSEPPREWIMRHSVAAAAAGSGTTDCVLHDYAYDDMPSVVAALQAVAKVAAQNIQVGAWCKAKVPVHACYLRLPAANGDPPVAADAPWRGFPESRKRLLARSQQGTGGACAAAHMVADVMALADHARPHQESATTARASTSSSSSSPAPTAGVHTVLETPPRRGPIPPLGAPVFQHPARQARRGPLRPQH